LVNKEKNFMSNKEQTNDQPSNFQDLAAVNQRLAVALAEQQRIAQLVIQKDLELYTLNDTLDRQVNQLKVLQLMVNEVRSLNNRDKALRLMARRLVQELQFSAVVVLLGPPPFTVGVKYSYHEIDTDELKRLPVIIKAFEKKIVYVDRLASAGPDEQALGKVLHATSFVALPLQCHQKFYGVFICALDDPYLRLSEHDREFLEIVSNAIAGTIESLDLEERQHYIDSLKTEFISIASHQLRTPLSAIKWILKMILNGDLGPLNAEQATYIDKTYKSNERMIELVNDLLDSSRIEEGRLEYTLAEVDARLLVKEILDQYRVLIDRQGVIVETNVDSGEPAMILADHDNLILALTNLIDNAIKFTPKKQTIKILVDHDRSFVRITVKDTGIGISAEDQQQLFTKFFRADNAKRMQTHGTGLGLFIANNIIRKHKGRIKVESEIGVGTTVTCWLPPAKGS